MADNNENKKDGGFNFPPVGGGKNIKAPKFNGYWMYIILAVIIIGFQFFNMNPDPVRTTWQEVKTKMLEKGDIEKITVITNKGQAQVYMKPDKIENYSQLKSQGFKNSSPGPQFYFSPGPLETFPKNFPSSRKRLRQQRISRSTMIRNTTVGETSSLSSSRSLFWYLSGFSSSAG